MNAFGRSDSPTIGFEAYHSKDMWCFVQVQFMTYAVNGPEEHHGKDMWCFAQVQFMTYAFGGPEEYHGKSMWAAHEKLVRDQGLKDHHFDIIVNHLVAALQQANVPEVSPPAAA